MDTLKEFLAEWHSTEPTVLVHTSGSTGEPKPLLVEKRRMEASACATIKALGLKPGSTALLCMPLKYIAGKMMVVRSVVGGLRLVSVEPSGHPLAAVDEAIDFAAMVPLQVYNSMENPQEMERLKAIDNIIIGGGSIDEEMERRLRDFPNAIWSTYGMTETLSHIALRRINGGEASEWYTPLENVNVSLSDEGCLVIDAPEVCADTLYTHDCAEINADGRRFRILGRIDNVIDSGGIKLHIEDIERKLRPYLPSFMITKVPHKKFGEAVVLMIERKGISENPYSDFGKSPSDFKISPRDFGKSPSDFEKSLRDILEQHLEKYELPKYIVGVDELPLTETGKPARKRAEEMASSSITHTQINNS